MKSCCERQSRIHIKHSSTSKSSTIICPLKHATAAALAHPPYWGSVGLLVFKVSMARRHLNLDGSQWMALTGPSGGCSSAHHHPLSSCSGLLAGLVTISGGRAATLDR